MREDAISMSHGFGDAVLQNVAVRTLGSPTSRLINTERHFDAITGMPRMSGIPVRVRLVEKATAEPALATTMEE